MLRIFASESLWFCDVMIVQTEISDCRILETSQLIEQECTISLTVVLTLVDTVASRPRRPNSTTQSSTEFEPVRGRYI